MSVELQPPLDFGLHLGRERAQVLVGEHAQPQMLCGEPPKTNRTLKINLRKGALEK